MASAELLLHICCGPCSIRTVQVLQAEGFTPLGFFYNPNIHPLSEYLKRRVGAAQCASRLGIDMVYDDAWDIGIWLNEQIPRAKDARRCLWCCGSRLETTAKTAANMGLKYFGTSLLYSRYQPHEYIHEKGKALARKFNLEFVYRDFRVYWQEGIDISKEWEIYRQAWCGCIFSEAERYAKKLARLK